MYYIGIITIICFSQDGNFSISSILEKPQNMLVVGQSAFADFGKTVFHLLNFSFLPDVFKKNDFRVFRTE